MTNNIKNTLAVMSERVSPSPSRDGHLTLSELRAYQSAWLDGAFACLALISREHRDVRMNNHTRKETDDTQGT